MKARWADEKDFLPASSPTYRNQGGVTIHLKAPIEEVQAVLTQHLNPNRQLVTAVTFGKDKIEEVTATKKVEGLGQVIELPVAPKEPTPAPAPPPPAPVAAATVARPTVGCPAPDFLQAPIRASEVLCAFLNDDQLEDYQKFGSFVSVAPDDHRMYMITSRERRDRLARYGGRTLFDLTHERALCVHDWSVPAAEEMLSMHLLIQTGHGDYLRGLEGTVNQEG